jgi:tRNA threonylcarbamoyladenosine biosynthesis protein TsaB
MLLLALDTSTRQSSIALCSEDMLYGEYTWQIGNNHSVELPGNIQRLVAECRLTIQDVEAVAVATGPGSFNGVRVAVATAKALAFALKKPLIGVSTLDSIAAQQQQWPGPVCAVLEAGRSELYAGCYRFDEIRGSEGDITYRMQQLGQYQLLAPQPLAATLREQAGAWFGVPGERQLPPFLFCGEISVTARQALRVQMQEGAFFVSNLQSARRASWLALLALQRLREGQQDDPLALEPLYLRRPSITTSTRKRPLLEGTSQRSTAHSTTEREEGALRH